MRKECLEELHTTLEVCDALQRFQLVHDALRSFQLVAESSRNHSLKLVESFDWQSKKQSTVDGRQSICVFSLKVVDSR